MEGLWAYLNNPDYPGEVIGQPFLKDSGLWTVALGLGKRNSRVQFQRISHKKYGKSCLRIEMNPRKLGPQGFKDLAKVLSSGGNQFDVPCLMAAAKVTRYDIAVDIVGAHVSEIIATHKPEGKRSLYVGSDGVLETIYIHKKKPPPKAIEYDDDGELIKKPTHSAKPAGGVALVVYDRLRERKALGWPGGPFGDAPVSRIEVVKGSLKNTLLANLADLPDALKDVRAGLGANQPQGAHSSWTKHIAVRRTASPVETKAILNLSSQTVQSLDEGLAVPVPDLVAPGANWPHWKTGLELTGLASLIAKAKKAPPMPFAWHTSDPANQN